ncbi:hypothetical protein B5P43_18260 [Bacillus sp. SRB_336]|nr:hypothetical protein B5P43_18260 [Bacillus sp. SRB_336]
MIRVIRIPQDEAEALSQTMLSNLASMQEAVGGMIEFITVDPIKASLMVDEQAKLYGKPINRKATLLWWLLEPAARQRDVIAGDALVVGCPDKMGDTTSAPDEVIELLLETACYKAEFQTYDDPNKFNGNLRRFTDYFEAANYALLKAQAWNAVERVRVVSAEDIKDCA